MAYYFNNLFPPVVPPNVSAYDGTKPLKFYFQVSVANSREQFNHVQVIINRLETNRNALSTVSYPLGIIFIKNQDIFYDAVNKLYYFELPSNLLPLNSYYKLQIRVGAQDITKVTTIDYVWLNNINEYNQFSEWSTVSILKPITVPAFDLEGFTSKAANGKYIEPVYETDNIVNVINSPGFLFVGNYRAMDLEQEEVISSYQFILYEDNGTTVEASWKILSDSGIKVINSYGSSSIQHSFDYTLEKNKTYYIKYRAESKNGYIGEKIYKALVMYADANLYNTLNIAANEEKAKISLRVKGKQLLFKKIGSTTIEPTKDNNSLPSQILYTHMIVNGEIKESSSLDFYAVDGKWVVQLRALGIKPMDTKEKALKNPILLIEETPKGSSPIYHKIKLCAVKCKISYDRETTTRWINDFILVKEAWNSKDGLVFKQEKYISFTNKGVIANSADSIGPMNEYYFYIKEDNGLIEFSASKVRTSTNTEVSNLTKNYKYKD